MQNKSVVKFIAGALIMSSFAFSVFTTGSGISKIQLANAAEGDPAPVCSALTLVSGTDAQVAGFTETSPSGTSTALDASLYSGGSFTAAVPASTAVIPPWIDPATHSDFTGSGAVWISSAANWPGDSGNAEGSAANDQWRLFHQSFTLPASSTINSAQISYAADNAAEVYLNGSSISTTGNVYGTSTATSSTNFSQVFNASFAPVSGSNTLDFVVRNWAGDQASNPTGLLYKAVINYCVPAPTFKVHILKYLDGVLATAASSSNYMFPINAMWQASNLNGGASTTGSFVLGNNEGGAVSLYGADSPALAASSSYSFSEDTQSSSTLVLPMGAACASGKYRLQGYQTSNASFMAAASSTMSTSSPAFVNLQSDQYVIVNNMTCPASTSTENGTLSVSSIDVAKSTSTADGTFEGGWRYVFHLTVPTNEPNVSLRFSDWMQNASSTGSSTIAVAGNMRISSAQAQSSSTVTLTAANAYSSPALVMNGDLDPNVPGKQVEVVVEVNIPLGTNSGSYTTNYGIRSLP